MAKITRIKATDPNKPKEKPEKEKKPKKAENPVKEAEIVKAPKDGSSKEKSLRSDKKALKTKKPFILFRPFVALGRYLRDSWLELRQVRWPNRKATWKMVLAVFIYTLVFGAFLLLLDVLFDLIFNQLIG